MNADQSFHTSVFTVFVIVDKSFGDQIVVMGDQSFGDRWSKLCGSVIKVLLIGEQSFCDM